jgi:hypothetical protein
MTGHAEGPTAPRPSRSAPYPIGRKSMFAFFRSRLAHLDLPSVRSRTPVSCYCGSNRTQHDQTGSRNGMSTNPTPLRGAAAQTPTTAIRRSPVGVARRSCGSSPLAATTYERLSRTSRRNNVTVAVAVVGSEVRTSEIPNSLAHILWRTRGLFCFGWGGGGAGDGDETRRCPQSIQSIQGFVPTTDL